MQLIKSASKISGEQVLFSHGSNPSGCVAVLFVIKGDVLESPSSIKIRLILMEAGGS